MPGIVHLIKPIQLNKLQLLSSRIPEPGGKDWINLLYCMTEIISNAIGYRQIATNIQEEESRKNYEKISKSLCLMPQS